MRTTLFATALAALILFSLPVVSDAMMATLERQYPRTRLDSVPLQDAIVVLGGYLRLPGNGDANADPDLNDAGDRLLCAAALYRAGKAPLLVASGGSAGALPEAVAAKRVLMHFGIPATAILAEGKSRNTQENASFTRALLASKGLKRIALVTSAAHMPRAAAAFRRTGLAVVPVPTDFRSGTLIPGDPGAWLPDANALADSNNAAREWLGLSVYRLFGWL